MQGLPWLNGNVRAVPASAVTSKVLCNRHNEALSPLDAVAGDLFGAFNDAKRTFDTTGTVLPRAGRVFSGYDIERWMLKVLCGMVSSRNATTMTGDLFLPGWQPPRAWLDILFGGAGFPDGCGLYFTEMPFSNFKATRRGQFVPLAPTPVDILGIAVLIWGFPFVLAMEPLDRIREFLAFEKGIYRPGGMRIESEGVVRWLVFRWEDCEAGEMIRVEWGTKEPV